MTEIVKVSNDEEIACVAKLAAEIWKEHYTGLLGERQVDYMLEKFQSQSAIKGQIDGGYCYYMLQSDGVSCGYFSFEEKEDKLFLSKLYVKKECRGKGIASRAFEFMTQYCRQNKLTAIWLTVNKGNANSIEVYRKKGFETVRAAVSDIGGGFFMDDYIMEKQL